MGKKALLLVPVLMFLLLLSAGSASATEGLRGQYPNGAEDCYAGCVPPPGTYFISYNMYMNWDRAYDYKGNRIYGPPSEGDGFATVFRFIKGTGCKILGADWFMHILLPVTYAHANGLGGLTPDDGHRWGLGNITINPMILAWHFGDWHFVTGVDINLPAPGWDKGNVVNGLGTGYWNAQPIFGFTYLNKSGFEVGAKFMYDYNWRNWQTGYKTGQEFHFDTAVAQKFKNGLLLGVAGYAWWQITEDKARGTDPRNAFGYLDDSDKARIFALGPMVRYDYKNMYFLLKAYREFEVKGTFSGDFYWFKWFYAF